jgi:hypothetical protein
VLGLLVVTDLAELERESVSAVRRVMLELVGSATNNLLD